MNKVTLVRRGKKALMFFRTANVLKERMSCSDLAVGGGREVDSKPPGVN